MSESLQNNRMQINWYPGHMTRAKRMMVDELKLIDVIVELVDARTPFSSRNPDIDQLAANKTRIILINKSDLADDVRTKEWCDYYESIGFKTIKLNSKDPKSIRQVYDTIGKAKDEKVKKDADRGIKNRPIRCMVVGIPNVGKSTFINGFVGRASAKTGNKPGVTKGKQWISLKNNIELLDTPGILWPKFENEMVGCHLAFIGSINDEVVNLEELALILIDYVRKNYKGVISKKYEIDEENKEAVRILMEIGKRRGCLKNGGNVDYEKAARLVFDDLRSGRLGKITLESVSEVIK